jgi:O-antigen ligase
MTNRVPIADLRLKVLIAFFAGLQLVALSFSIALASMSLGVMVLLALFWWIHERCNIWQPTPLDYFFLAYVGIELLTSATAIHPSQAFFNAKRLLLITNLYIILAVFDSRKKIAIVLGALIVCTAIQSVAEIIYYFAKNESRLYIFQHYMTTGGMKMIVSLLSIPIIFQSGIPRKWRVAALACFIPILIALVLTNTRSSWLGFIAGAGVIAILKEKKLILVLAVLIAGFFLFAPQKNIDRAKSVIDLNHPSNAGRLMMWSTGLKIFADHPWLGVGDSDLYEIYSGYRTPDDNEPAGHLHNNYIMLLVTLGVFGFAIVMAIFGRTLLAEYRIFRAFGSDWLVGPVILGALGVLCGFLVNGFFEWNFGSHQIMVLVWSSVGLAFAAERIGKAEAAL